MHGQKQRGMDQCLYYFEGEAMTKARKKQERAGGGVEQEQGAAAGGVRMSMREGWVSGLLLGLLGWVGCTKQGDGG